MNLINQKLIIPSTIWDKVLYFLKKFPSLEWSGPAWYSHEKDENGFPTEVKLEYFHPLHLGTASETDWDGKELIKIYKPLRKEFPEIGKSWVQGNIHSHHSMGAFFSGTDIQQCEDGANENFYYSLVVSTKPGKEVHFGVSYPDQFGNVHVLEFDDIEIETLDNADKEWIDQAKYIKKNKTKTAPQLYTRKHNSYYKEQGTLFGVTNAEQATNQNTKQDRYEEWMDVMSYNNSFGAEIEELGFAQWDAYDTLMLDYEKGRIKKNKLKKELKKIGVDEHGQPIPS
tara:strand:- start:144 stop:995 length:852 start_codon:yes stop_codon:yes gene_type:complete